MMTALGRGLHRQEHAQPWVLDDPFALPLIGAAWPELYAGIGQLVSEPLLRRAAALTAARSRYAEDRLNDSFTALALPCTGSHVYAPMDFETATLREALSAVGLDWSQPTLYSWLGVTGYLASDAMEATLQVVAGGAAGSEIVMGYVPTPPFLDEMGAEFLAVFRQLAAQSGEPMDTSSRRLKPRQWSSAVGCRWSRTSAARSDLSATSPIAPTAS
jgi:O-methyltransferase involved in polyketide biosynthesis